MVKISPSISRSLREYVIKPSYTTAETTYDKVNISVELAPDVILEYPFIAAAMSCVSGYDMTLACARNGMMAVVPCSISIDEQADIVRRVKKQEVRRGDIEFVQDPLWIEDTDKLADAFRLYGETGHSTIPICDDFRRLKGIFNYKEGWGDRFQELTLQEALAGVQNGSQQSQLGRLITVFNLGSLGGGKDYFLDTDKPEYMHERMKSENLRCVPVVSKNGSLMKLAFIYKFHGYMVGAAIHTHPGWYERAKALVDAGADIIFIDSSNCKSYFQLNVIREFKKKHPEKPICAGNGVDEEGYRMCTDAGADMFKIGMGSGGSCITTSGRGVGRGLATALQEVHEANKNAKEIPLIGDGGIGTKKIKEIEVDTPEGRKMLRYIKHDPSGMAKALALSPWGIMMGTGFNITEEAAGDVFEYHGERFKHRWGEGSFKARTLARYGIGEGVRRAFIEEGIDDFVSCAERVKPSMECNALNLRMTLSNVGARNLKEFSENVVLELMSEEARKEADV